MTETPIVQPVTLSSPARRKVLLIASNFPPEGSIMAVRAAKFCKYLPDFGYEPIVLTRTLDTVDFRQDSSQLAELAGREIIRARGWRRFWINCLKKQPGNFFRWFCFRPDEYRFIWSPAAYRAASDFARQEPIDAIVVTVPANSSALLGVQLRKRLGVPLIVDYRDPWTNSLWTVWPTRWHYQRECRMESRVLAAADAITVVTPTMRDILAERFPHCAEKLHVVHNGFDSSEMEAATSFPQPDQFNIAFTGGLWPDGTKQAGAWVPSFIKQYFFYRYAEMVYPTPRYLLEAVRKLLDEQPELASYLRLTFAGVFKNEHIVERLQLQEVVKVHSWLPRREAMAVLQSADLAFLPILYEASPRRNFNLSGKLFEYIGMRKPILAAVPDGDVRDFIARARIGWCVDPEDVDGMKKLLVQLIQAKRDGTWKMDPDHEYIAQFERRTLTGRLAAILDSLLQNQKS